MSDRSICPVRSRFQWRRRSGWLLSILSSSRPSMSRRIFGSVPGVAQQHAARAGQFLLGFLHELGDMPGSLSSGGFLFADFQVALRLRIFRQAGLSSLSGLPVSSMMRRICSALTMPSPVVLKSRKIMWPLCSPPTLSSSRIISSMTFGRRPACAGLCRRRLRGFIEADIAHHGGDERVLGQGVPARAYRARRWP